GHYAKTDRPRPLHRLYHISSHICAIDTKLATISPMIQIYLFGYSAFMSMYTDGGLVMGMPAFGLNNNFDPVRHTLIERGKVKRVQFLPYFRQTFS
ncbi:hypothetical protein BDZ91DRAFT_841455, partial [Kalaharituber pfeilii]